jgi:hypothetical protein
LRQQAKTYEQNGQVAPLSIRQDLDTYIHFVKAVSTLTPQQLDTPDPQVITPPVTTPVAPQLVAKGDFNGDLKVDKADFVKLRNLLGTTTSPFTGADANGDGLVDAADYTVWKQNFGQLLTPPAPPTSPLTGTVSPLLTDLVLATKESDSQPKATLGSTTTAPAEDNNLLLLNAEQTKATDGTKVTSTTTTRTTETTKSLKTLDLAFESWGL